MGDDYTSNVPIAFGMLLEEIEAEIDYINQIGASFLDKRDYESSKKALERAEKLTQLEDRVAKLLEEWKGLSAVGVREKLEEPDSKLRPKQAKTSEVKRRNFGRLPRGQKTSESQFFIPILRALDDMGGSAKVGDVLHRVAEIMQPILRDIDYQKLPSPPNEPRWRNTAQWARYRMIRNGLLKNDSKRGVWEITKKGRRTLEESD